MARVWGAHSSSLAVYSPFSTWLGYFSTTLVPVVSHYLDPVSMLRLLFRSPSCYFIYFVVQAVQNFQARTHVKSCLPFFYFVSLCIETKLGGRWHTSCSYWKNADDAPSQCIREFGEHHVSEIQSAQITFWHQKSSEKRERPELKPLRNSM